MKKLYHGSPKQGIEKFELGRSTRNYLNEGEGVYLSENRDVARDYAVNGGSVYEVSLKSGAMFDATKYDDFEYCVQLLVKELGENFRVPRDLAKQFAQQVDSIVEGRWSVTQFPDSLRLLVTNTEEAANIDLDVIAKAVDKVNEYMDDHPIIKYVDSTIDNGKSFCYVVRDASLVKVIKEMPVDEG